MTTNLEEASRCPRCKEPGRTTSTHVVQRERGGKASLRTLTCDNERCRWYGTSWVVQINPDGTIPQRAKGDKEFPDLDPYSKAFAKRMLENLEDGQEFRL